MTATAAQATTDLSWWGRHKQRKTADKKYIKDEVARLLAYAGQAGRRVPVPVVILLFILAAVVAKYSVDGAYDVTLETHAPLLQTGVGAIAFGLLLITIFSILRAQGRRVSLPTAIFFGILLMIYGGGLLYYHFAVPGLVDNTAAWHHAVSNGQVRDQKWRDWPEGLVTGLYWAYWSWNSIRRNRRPHPLQHLFGFKFRGREYGWYANTVTEKPELNELMLFVLFPLILLFAWPAARGMWSLESLIGQHDSTIHTWLAIHADWLLHVNNSLQVSTTATMNFLNSIKEALFADWPIFLTGIISAQFFGRLPAFGVIDDAQDYNALRRIARTGSLEKALAWHYRIIRMNGMIVRIAQIWEEGENSEFHDAVAFAKDELKNRGPGISFMFKAAPWAIAILWIIGFTVVGLHVRI